MAEIGDEFVIGGRKLAQLKNDELKQELEKRGLKKSGNKAALIERLSEVKSQGKLIKFLCLLMVKYLKRCLEIRLKTLSLYDPDIAKRVGCVVKNI